MMSCVYAFPCQRWFAKDEDDGRVSRELVAGKGDAGIPYTVQVFTGEEATYLNVAFRERNEAPWFVWNLAVI